MDLMTIPAHAPSDPEALLGTREVASLLGMSREQVWRLWTSGRLPGYRFDRLLRFAPTDVERFKADCFRAGRARSRPASARRERPSEASATFSAESPYTPI
jgi:excisionase family DNA binding protein